VVFHRSSGRGVIVSKEKSKISEEATMEFEGNDTVGGYAVPVDPMDMLQCDSCQ